MAQNILITGAAGYIGGSVLADFISTTGPIKAANLIATVRAKEQVEKLAKLGTKVIQVDLRDEKAVVDAVISNDIDIVVHAASSIEAKQASNLINALGRRRKATGKEVYLVHSSITALFAPENGWPYGEVKDTDAIFEKEKELSRANAVRETNILVTELSQAQGVTTFDIAVPNVYGRGTGEVRKLSVFLPASIRASVAHRKVYKFDKDASPAAAHISDLTDLYAIIVSKILQNKPIPSGEKGHYFAIAHGMPRWTTADRIAAILHARGLVDEPVASVWPSDAVAAEQLGFPVQHVRAMGVSEGKLVPVNAFKLGWKPKWDEERFLNSLEDEVKDTLELDTVKATVFNSLIGTDR